MRVLVYLPTASYVTAAIPEDRYKVEGSIYYQYQPLKLLMRSAADLAVHSSSDAGVRCAI